MNKENKAVWGWAMYDWANSAFATTVMAGFFPVFFRQFWSYGADTNLTTARLGFANASAGLIVALAAPVLGAMADKGFAKKKFLIGFAYLGVLMTAALFLVQRGQWGWAAFVFAMGYIGFAGANIFYDALLPGVAGEKSIDFISGFGFSLGYLGGGLLFLIDVLMTRMPEKFGLPDAAAAVRFSFITVALWWGLFTLFTIFWISEERAAGPTPPSRPNLVIAGLKQFTATLKKVRHLKTLFLFLLAYWFYIDGVDTIIRMAVDYGMAIGFEADNLIVALLIVQFVGFPAALVFGKLGQHWGVRKAIFLALAVYQCVTVLGVFMDDRKEFYVLAVVIGLVQGGLQALSRSYYARLIPPGHHAAEFYGFYNMLGKFAAIIGPALMGAAGLIARKILMPPAPTPEQITHIGILASRWSIASVSLLFIIGGILFYFVDEKNGRAQIDQWSHPCPK